ncbi:hypothetical protein GCM10009030_34980 [Haloarcula pellucida]|uniref:Uncharacterized protein n=2 Tax=Haloarculaceae TaxID=1963268 RepID=A0A830GTL4_9EURY|nr:hypothetical protein GCM10009030_34980 [Halomicroarcula pellucida]
MRPDSAALATVTRGDGDAVHWTPPVTCAGKQYAPPRGTRLLDRQMSDSASLQRGPRARVQTSVEQLLKQPVKEAVREVLAEGAQSDAADAAETDSEPPSEPAQSESTADDGDQIQTSSGRRLPSRRVLSVAVLALFVYLRRRRRSGTTEG